MAGCKRGEPPPLACIEGAVRSCEGEYGCHGDQRCEGEPPHWSRCECDAVPPEGDGGAATDASAPRPRLGSPCETDATCPGGAVCSTTLSGVFFDGAPAAGTCVADCSSNRGQCDAFENAVCIDVERRMEPHPEVLDEDAGIEQDAGAAPSRALCFERCEVGGASAGKCHELPQLACEPLSNAQGRAGFCRPVCSRDLDCGEELFCDRRTGACVDGLTTSGGALGTPCEAGQGSDCEGLCVDVNEARSLCSHRCVFGSANVCASSTPSRKAGGCLTVTPGGGIGDVGFCIALCDCPGDCPDETAVCDPFEDEALERTFGALGTCIDPKLALHEPLSCP